MRRRLSETERSELMDEKNVYEDMIQPYGVLHSVITRCNEVFDWAIFIFDWAKLYLTGIYSCLTGAYYI